jgi:hypothetical protein
MIDYAYTQVDRLREPHKYMYTPYYGSKFLDVYLKDRLKNIKRFHKYKVEVYNNKVDSYFCYAATQKLDSFLKDGSKNLDIQYQHINNSLNNGIESISNFEIKDNIQTNKLLPSIIFNQLDGTHKELIKQWLDRLVQRFEVTKKIYEVYRSGFRKGEGKRDFVRLYWLFGLALALHYVDTKNIKYLNTLLKISDLLCSLNDDVLIVEITSDGMLLILSVEMMSVKMLLNNIKG